MSKNFQSSDFKTLLLADGFTGDLIIPTDLEYEASLTRFAKNAQKNAGLVAFVKSSEDVSKVIKLVNSRSSSSGSINVVVRGGGHSTSGSSSTEGGIVIDLSRYLNTVRVDQETKLGYVGGGATWSAVDKEAIKYQLAGVGGTVSHTGVGGLSLGGGYGWLTGEQGLTVDNIVQVTLVVSDGSILTVSATSHPDLFWGIRGGGPNFGCVTEFVYQLHPQRPTVFAGPLLFPSAAFPAVMSALQEWHPNASEKEAAIVVTTSKGPMGGPITVALIFYNGDEEEGRKRFAKVIALGPLVDAARMIPYELVNELQNAAVPYGANYHLTGSLRGEKGVSPDVANNVLDQLIEISNAPGDCATEGAPKMTIAWEFFNLKRMSRVQADATAFRMRVAHPAMPLSITWEGVSPEATADAKDRLRRLKQYLEDAMKDSFDGGLGENDTGYGNYDTGNPQDVDSAAPLYGANYPRLQELKKEYDPVMMFRSWYPIQPMKTAA